MGKSGTECEGETGIKLLRPTIVIIVGYLLLNLLVKKI